jgi:uncharacterized membrane protein
MPFHPHAPFGQFGIVFAILGGLSWLAIVAGIVLLVIWAARALTNRPVVRTSPAATAAESPLDILSRRFAMGEITPDEFERSRGLLRGEPPAAASIPPPPSG